MGTPVLANLSALYKSEKLADCELRFYRSGQDVEAAGSVPSSTAGTPAAGCSSRAWLTEPFPAHKVILALCSERLEAQMMDPAWQSGINEQEGEEAAALQTAQEGCSKAHSSDDDGSSRPPKRQKRPLLLSVPLEGEHEVEAALEVLRFMYMGQLTAGLTPMQLLMARKLAQYLLCSSCSAACSAALVALTSVSAADALAACSCPHVAFMLDEPDLAGFVAVCAPSLVQHLNNTMTQQSATPATSSQQDAASTVAAVSRSLAAVFSNTLRVMRRERLATAFCGLSIPSLQQLLQPAAATVDGAGGATVLPVDCEETVLLLLDCWVQHNKPSAEAKLQLRKLLRPLQLGTTYAQYLLPLFQWLGLSNSDLLELRFVRDATCTVDYKELSLLGSLDVTKAEPQWLLEPRTYVPPTAEDSTTEFSATWTRQELQVCLDKARATASTASSASRDGRTALAIMPGPKLYYGGFEWHLQTCGYWQLAEAADWLP